MDEKPRITKSDYIPCPKCGEPNHPSFTWCEECGKLLASEPSFGEWVTWLLLGVIAVSLLGAGLPAWQLAGDDCMFCPGILGVMGGCIVLLIWLIRKDRGTRHPDWVSLIAVGVMLVPVGVLMFAIFPTVLSSAVGGIGPFWFYVEGETILKWPTAVATLGYVVLLVRLLGTALRRRTMGALWVVVALAITVIIAVIIGGVLRQSQHGSMPITSVPTLKPRVLDEPEVVTCSDVLTITLDAVPQDYRLELVSSEGDGARVHCVDGQTRQRAVDGKSAYYISCIDRGVRWTGPQTFSTVTVTWNGRQVVQHLEHGDGLPSDGWELTPCISGSITVTLPASP